MKSGLLEHTEIRISKLRAIMQVADRNAAFP